ncbi:hypothetical protein NECAME_16042 [Necator americanus]|uniref:Uncharacterized protein n=1 Tax=Necator americanus TaxID=51031 RepID=W2U0W9_NECAM|nr:hypothetical protein NECAME_16042 [Necator americanus]ETN86957.1 hypothetical protein NECAME_16042 [Necator americanus]
MGLSQIRVAQWCARSCLSFATVNIDPTEPISPHFAYIHVCSRHMSHSPSVGDSQNLLHNESDRRKSSAPACGLTVDTSGGETAGSGYGWLTASEAPEPYHGVVSVVRAQQIALQMVKERIRLTKQQIDACRKDEQLIADFVADALAEEMNVDRTKLSYKKLEEQVKHLEEEIEELRKLSPRVVPPPS